MSAERVDRRVRRTHAMLQHALQELILEKGFERVTVQDILDRADVGRSTFYAHFRDKEDLLLSGFERLHESFELPGLEAPVSPATQFARLSRELFTHAEQSRRFFKAMLGRQSGDFLLREAQSRFSAMFVGILGRMQPDVGAMRVEPAVIVQFAASSLLSTLVWWLDTDAPYSAEEMDARYRALVLPGIAAALGLSLPEVTAG